MKAQSDYSRTDSKSVELNVVNGNLEDKNLDEQFSSKMHTVNEGVGLENTIYTSRFTSEQERVRSSSWRVLCRDFFQRYILPSDTIVDIGAGDGLFLKNIRASKKIAVDLSEHAKELEKHGIEVIQVSASQFVKHLSGSVDVVFMSNFLEHLPNKAILLEVLAECRRALKPGGLILILQPNVRYAGSAYWDYIDHHIALTEHSLVEALQVTGFNIERVVPQFVPYTAKSFAGSFSSWFNPERVMEWYLRIPILWRVFGGQTFVVASVVDEKKKNLGNN